MTEKYSISRQKAEVAFSNIQTPFFAKDKALDELEFDHAIPRRQDLAAAGSTSCKGTV